MLLQNIIFSSKRIKSYRIVPQIYNGQKMHYIPMIKSRKMNEQFYLNKDKIAEDYTIIYRAPMENYLTISKNVTTISAGIVSAIVGYNLWLGEKLNTISEDSNLGDLMIEGSDLIMFSFGFIFVTLALRIFISKYPLRIYKNNNKYIAVFQGQLPFKNSKLYFNKGEVIEVEPNIFNPWSNSMYQIGNKKSLLLTEYFKTSSEFTNMMLPPIDKK